MCKDILDFSYGKKSQKSNVIQEFVVSRDQFEPNVFYVWERYNSNADLGRHNSCTEYNAFMENVRPCFCCDHTSICRHYNNILRYLL